MNRLEAAENQDPTKQIILDRAILEYKKEYKKGSLTPELVNKTWQTIWQLKGGEINQVLEVPACDRTKKELSQLKKENKGVLLVPDNLDLIMLGKMFPAMNNWAVQEGTTIVDGKSKGGCIDIEMDLKSPNRGTNEAQATELLKAQGRDGQRLKINIIGSQFSKLLTGHYFDEDTWSRLPGSSRDGRMVGDHFDSNGRLNVYWDLYPRHPYPHIGFRSEGVKKV